MPMRFLTDWVQYPALTTDTAVPGNPWSTLIGSSMNPGTLGNSPGGQAIANYVIGQGVGATGVDPRGDSNAYTKACDLSFTGYNNILEFWFNTSTVGGPYSTNTGVLSTVGSYFGPVRVGPEIAYEDAADGLLNTNAIKVATWFGSDQANFMVNDTTIFGAPYGWSKLGFYHAATHGNFGVDPLTIQMEWSNGSTDTYYGAPDGAILSSSLSWTTTSVLNGGAPAVYDFANILPGYSYWGPDLLSGAVANGGTVSHTTLSPGVETFQVFLTEQGVASNTAYAPLVIGNNATPHSKRMCTITPRWAVTMRPPAFRLFVFTDVRPPLRLTGRDDGMSFAARAPRINRNADLPGMPTSVQSSKAPRIRNVGHTYL